MGLHSGILMNESEDVGAGWSIAPVRRTAEQPARYAVKHEHTQKPRLESTRITDATAHEQGLPIGMLTPYEPLDDSFVVVYFAPAEPVQVRAARRCALDACIRWGIAPEIRETVRVITSELAGNVVEHSGSQHMTLVVSCTVSNAQIQVVDHGRWKSTPSFEGEALSERGRGWALVDSLAARSGVQRTEYGTRAWAEVRLHRDSKPTGHEDGGGA